MHFTLIDASETVIDSVIIYAVGLPDSLYFGNSLPTTIDLPLNLNSDTTEIFLKYRFQKKRSVNTNNTFNSSLLISDTLWVIYQKSVKLNELECGFITEFQLKKLISTINLIDSIPVYDSTITTTNKTHAEIYF